MNDVPDFQVAVDRLRQFLRESGHGDDIFWLFRDDLYLKRLDRAIVRFPPPPENEPLARKVYEEGKARGLVDVHALVTDGSKVGVTVWFPKFPEDQVQGWDRNLKVSIRQPLARLVAVRGFLWKILTWLPPYRAFQKTYGFVGTRKWAAAALD
jgi:hypothetical protein